jgi:SepF-like predicted cell division protein (DUF552 family)
MQRQQLSLKTISIHNYSQLSEIEKSFLQQKEPVILIARITPLALKDPEELGKFVGELYAIAVKNNYSVFRLGEERIIVIPSSINVEK